MADDENAGGVMAKCERPKYPDFIRLSSKPGEDFAALFGYCAALRQDVEALWKALEEVRGEKNVLGQMYDYAVREAKAQEERNPASYQNGFLAGWEARGRAK